MLKGADIVEQEHKKGGDNTEMKWNDTEEFE
jgi:hypothetical protein